MKRISGDDVVEHVLRDHGEALKQPTIRTIPCRDGACPNIKALIIAGFLAAMLATGAIGLCTARPSYASDHSTSSIADLSEVMRRHTDPARRAEARSVLIHRAIDCIEAVRATVTTMHAEELERELDAVRKVLR